MRAKLERQSKARLRKTSVREARSAERPKTQRRTPSSNSRPQFIVTESLTNKTTEDAKGKDKLKLTKKVMVKDKDKGKVKG